MNLTHTITWGLVVRPELALNLGIRSVLARASNAGTFAKLHSKTHMTTHVDSEKQTEEQHGL